MFLILTITDKISDYPEKNRSITDFMCSKRKAIAILQPVYLPWMGYFEQMAYVDLFVFLDDVQYTKRDWRNRNQIKTANGSSWLTVPIRKHNRNALINEIEINYSTDWVHQHTRSIEVSYKRCTYFEPLFGELCKVLTSRPRLLVDLDKKLTLLLARYLDIDTPTALSSSVLRAKLTGEGDRNSRKNGRILDICRHFGAEVLYDGAKAADFIDVDRFRNHGIEVVFQNYEHPAYSQAFGDFLSHQSVIDLIMNTGPEAGILLRSSRLPSFLGK